MNFWFKSVPKPPLDCAKLREACDQLETGLAGTLAETVSAHEKMILQYYQDVQQQATQSFGAAKVAAGVGFSVLILTLAYCLVFDGLAHYGMAGNDPVQTNLLTVGGIGVVSGVLIEFIAGINFWLYGRAAIQFGAFHICLERTHRYLIAYKICEEMKEKRDETLQNIVCIMANAPMITAMEVGRVTSVAEKIEQAKDLVNTPSVS
jgi:hypothetical protein